MKLLIILTSHSQLGETQLGNTEGKTGFWIEEFATPYYLFKAEGYDITLASPKGGQPPIDPKSEAPENQTESVIRYKNDAALLHQMAHTHKLTDIIPEDYDAVFFPGGHGPLWDLTKDKNAIAIIENFWKTQKPVAAVCHAPAVLLHVKDQTGNLLVKGRNVTGYSNSEEEAAQLTKVVPFLLEDQLKMNGAHYSKAGDFAPHTVTDGLLITGQNPASSEGVAKALIKLLKKA